MDDLTFSEVSDHSTFLFRTPSFVDGAASVLDLGGQNYYCYATTDSEAGADLRAFWHDARAVVDDLVSVLVSSIKS